MRYLLALLVLFIAPVSTAQAALVINFLQSGSNVVATASGTVNLTGLTLLANSNVSPGIFPGGASAVIGPTGSVGSAIYSGITGPSSFGLGISTAPDSGTGSRVGITGSQFFLPAAYVTGSAINSSSTFNNKTLASMGLTPGSYTWTWSSDTATINVGPVAVPEPSSMALLGLCAAGYAVRQWRRRNC